MTGPTFGAVDPEWERQVWEFLTARRREYKEHALVFDSREEQDMEMKAMAPSNPYRGGESLGGFTDLSSGLPGRYPRRSDREDGPGLTAGDIDAIARQHFRDGYAAGERGMEPRVEALEAARAGVYDEGYAAGRIERAKALANALRGALQGELLGTLFHLAIEQKPQLTRAGLRSGAAEAHAQLIAVLDELKRIEDGEHDAFVVVSDADMKTTVS